MSWPSILKIKNASNRSIYLNCFYYSSESIGIVHTRMALKVPFPFQFYRLSFGFPYLVSDEKLKSNFFMSYSSCFLFVLKICLHFWSFLLRFISDQVFAPKSFMNNLLIISLIMWNVNNLIHSIINFTSKSKLKKLFWYLQDSFQFPRIYLILINSIGTCFITLVFIYVNDYQHLSEAFTPVVKVIEILYLYPLVYFIFSVISYFIIAFYLSYKLDRLISFSNLSSDIGKKLANFNCFLDIFYDLIRLPFTCLILNELYFVIFGLTALALSKEDKYPFSGIFTAFISLLLFLLIPDIPQQTVRIQ